MIKKWDVAPSPGEKNPGRHKLRIKGDMRDIFLIVKKLGGTCSRPEKTSGDFDFIIYLTNLEAETKLKLDSVIAELSQPVSEPSDTFAKEPQPFESPKIRLQLEPEMPAFIPQPPAPVNEAPAVSARADVFEPKPPEPAIPVVNVAQPQPDKSQKRMKPGLEVPSMSRRVKKEEPAPAPAPVPDQKPGPAVVLPPVSGRAKTKWSMELPLIPTYSFQTLIAGSHNRFAHAAAMAVVENPGVIYNPLLIFGTPGTGKTHFSNSISYGLSSQVGQGNIFVTDGIKFSRGVEIAIKEGEIARLDELFAGIKVLIIDDIHLLMISEANKKYISKWLNDFVAQNKQIVVTSVFPPKSLAGLEDAVGFQFTQGWMVDLKMPGAQAYRSILGQLIQGQDVKLSEAELNTFFASGLMPFTEAVKTLESMKKMEKFIVNSMNSQTHAQLLEMLLGASETPDATPLAGEDITRSGAWQPSQGESWFKWGIFFPKGMRREAQFALFSLRERAEQLGLVKEWSQVFMEEYDSDELYGIPFKIGNYASERNVNGVIILGPQPASALGTQEAEFRHITFKILDSYLIKCAWLPSGKLKSKSAYAKMLVDLV